jgi:sensor histidine kinase regulating citrate/malate metabolism
MSYEQKAKEIQLEQEMKAYSEQLNIMNESQKRIQIIRHDTRHHLAMLQSLIKSEKALQYVNTAFDFINYSNEYAKSGNAEINTILNYKLNQAHELDIKVNLALSVPDKLVVQPFDLSIILGNLLDNAIRATSRLKEKEQKKIDIQIEYDRNIIYIFITNPFDGKIIYCDGKYKTTQEDNGNHALGLSSVKNSIEKYNGEISFSHEDNLFRVSALFYDSAVSLCG